MISLLEFVNSRRTKGTQGQYRQSLCLFFECLSGATWEGRNRPPDHVTLMDSLSIEYLNTQHDYLSDLIKFVAYLEKYSQNAKILHLTTTILWLELNDITLKRAQIDFIRSGAGKRMVETEHHILTHDEMHRWYMALSRLGRVVLMTQLATGMRLGEVLGLEPEDIDLDAGWVWVRRAGPKTKSKTPKNQKPRYTFLTDEAVIEIREWMTYRETWMNQASRKWFKQDHSHETRVFPCSQNTIQEAYTRGLIKIGLFEQDPNTNWGTVTSHSIRKYFNSQLKLGMPEIMVEKLLGHVGYLNGVYDQYTPEQIRAEYDKNCHLICLHAAENLPAIKADLQSQAEFSRSLASENMRLQQQLQSEMREREEQARRISAIEAAMSKR